jgi:hypothetical protein
MALCLPRSFHHTDDQGHVYFVEQIWIISQERVDCPKVGVKPDHFGDMSISTLINSTAASSTGTSHFIHGEVVLIFEDPFTNV